MRGVSAWEVTASTLVRLLPSVGVGMGLQMISSSAWVVTAATLIMLLPSVDVGMGLQITSLSAWEVTAATLVRFFPSVDHLVSLEIAYLGSGVATHVTALHTSVLHPFIPQHLSSGLLDELVNLCWVWLRFWFIILILILCRRGLLKYLNNPFQPFFHMFSHVSVHFTTPHYI